MSVRSEIIFVCIRALGPVGLELVSRDSSRTSRAGSRQRSTECDAPDEFLSAYETAAR